MGNPLRGEVSLEAAGKTYTMHMSVNALCVLEGEIGKTAPEIFAELDTRREKVSVTRIRAILWAALTDHHPELTQKEAGKIIGEAGGIVTVLGKLAEAIAAAFPPPEAKSDEARPT